MSERNGVDVNRLVRALRRLEKMEWPEETMVYCNGQGVYLMTDHFCWWRGDRKV